MEEFCTGGAIPPNRVSVSEAWNEYTGDNTLFGAFSLVLSA